MAYGKQKCDLSYSVCWDWAMKGVPHECVCFLRVLVAAILTLSSEWQFFNRHHRHRLFDTSNRHVFWSRIDF